MKEKSEFELARLRRDGFDPHPKLVPVIQQALKHQFAVQAVRNAPNPTHEDTYSTRLLYINEYYCSIHSFDTVSPGGQGHAPKPIVHVSPGEEFWRCQFAILHFMIGALPEVFLVVPIRTILVSKLACNSFIVPAERPRLSEKSHPKFDWWQYENRWDLLRRTAKQRP